MTIGSSLRAIDILGEIWFTCDMTKPEAIAYLRKKVMLERLSVSTEPNPEAAKELKEMEQSSDNEEKNLTTEESNV